MAIPVAVMRITSSGRVGEAAFARLPSRVPCRSDFYPQIGGPLSLAWQPRKSPLVSPSSKRETDAVEPLLLVGVVLGISLLLTFPLLTSLGARRRGLGVLATVAAGIFFPVTWAVWYIRDEHPYRRAHRQT